MLNTSHIFLVELGSMHYATTGLYFQSLASYGDDEQRRVPQAIDARLRRANGSLESQHNKAPSRHTQRIVSYTENHSLV